jgi:hypothetical protein
MPHKIDKAEWRPILRAASELLARVVLAGVDGRISRDEAAAILAAQGSPAPATFSGNGHKHPEEAAPAPL